MAPHRDEESHSTKASESFANSCGADLAHARHVAKLAVEILDQMTGVADFTPADRKILSHAALLQDVGYLINYKQHHKHSYQLIVNSHLPGLRRHELELIANVARYHRGAQPKSKHGNYRKLAKSDRLRVMQLSALLRLAGALDRGYLQRVQSVSLTEHSDRVELSVQSTGDIDLELWSVRGKGELFERVFGRRLLVLPHREQQPKMRQTQHLSLPETAGTPLRKTPPEPVAKDA
jgi:exopolyphosphatase/guanosine-5'-triphosphate,3'-diphosphate pyrophosphatase